MSTRLVTRRSSLILCLAATLVSCAGAGGPPSKDPATQVAKPVAATVGPESGPTPPAPPPAASTPPQSRLVPPSEMPPAAQSDLPAVGVETQVACTEPSPPAIPCRWVALWRRYLSTELHLPERFLADHVRVGTWGMMTAGDRDTFIIHYDLVEGWATVRMNDAFIVRRDGKDVGDDAMMAELRARPLTGPNEPHGWYLRQHRALLARAAADAKLRSCQGVPGSNTDAQPDLAEDGALVLSGTSVPKPQGACTRGIVDLETGKVSCGGTQCAIFAGSPPRASTPASSSPAALPPIKTECTKDDQCAVLHEPPSGDSACCPGQCSEAPGTKDSIRALQDACVARRQSASFGKCEPMMCKPSPPEKPACRAGHCVVR